MHWGRQSPCVHCSGGEALEPPSGCPTGESCGRERTARKKTYSVREDAVLCVTQTGPDRLGLDACTVSMGPRTPEARKQNDFVVVKVSKAAPRRSLLSPHHRHPKCPAEIVVKPACAESEEWWRGGGRGTPPPRRPPHRGPHSLHLGADDLAGGGAAPLLVGAVGQRLELRRHAAAVELQLVRVVRAQLEIVRDRDRRDAAARAPGDAHTCACTCTHARAHAHAHMHMHMHMHTCTCTCTCTCAHAHAHMHMRTCAHAHAHMHIHTCTCAHAHAHMHMHT